MPIKVSGTWRDTKAWWVKVAGVWREGSGVHTKVAGVWREEAFVEPLAVVASPDDLAGSAPGFAFTGNCTCTPSGGVAPYSFLWQHVSGTPITIQNSTSNVTSFSSAVTATSVYRCRVTDDDSTIVFSNNVDIELTVFSF